MITNESQKFEVYSLKEGHEFLNRLDEKASLRKSIYTYS